MSYDVRRTEMCGEKNTLCISNPIGQPSGNEIRMGMEIERLRAELAERDSMPSHTCRRGLRRVGSADACEDCCGAFITNEQIDAAVQMITNWGKKGTSIDRDAERLGWFVLNRIGIVACEKCGGSGEKCVTGYDERLHADTDAEYPCPACHAHGWRRSEK